MQIVRLGNLVLGILAPAEELAERGVSPTAPDGEALLRLVWDVCRQEGVRPSRVDDVAVSVDRGSLTILGFLLPPERECFLFEGLGEALDALCAAGAGVPRSCTLLRCDRGYVAATGSARCGTILSEFGLRLDDRAALRTWARGEVLAQGRQLAALLCRRR